MGLLQRVSLLQTDQSVGLQCCKSKSEKLLLLTMPRADTGGLTWAEREIEGVQEAGFPLIYLKLQSTFNVTEDMRSSRMTIPKELKNQSASLSICWI